MRRHDLHSVLIENVLYVTVKLRKHDWPLFRPFQRKQMDEQTILNIEVAQGPLYNARWWLSANASGPAGRQQ
jgi:hypothetical protein